MSEFRLYPDMAFVTGYVPGPPQELVARSILATDYFSGGNPLAKEWLSEFAHLAIMDMRADDPDNTALAMTWADSVFEEPEGAALAFDYSYHFDPDTDDASPLVMATNLAETWQLIKQQDRLAPVGAALREFIGEAKRDEVVPAAVWRNLHNRNELALYAEALPRLGDALLYLDSRRLDPSSMRITSGMRPPESHFHEAVLDRDVTTGVTAFDIAFGLVRQATMAGSHLRGLFLVKRLWERWGHPGAFLTATYMEDYRNQPSHAVTGLLDRAQRETARWEEVSAALQRAGWRST